MNVLVVSGRFCLMVFLLFMVFSQFSFAQIANDLPAKLGQGKWQMIKINTDGFSRWSLVYIPKDISPKAPVVLLLHGGTQSMRKIFRPNAGGNLEWPILADKEKFLLLAPNGTDPETGDTFSDKQNWHDLRPEAVHGKYVAKMNDVKFIRELLDWAGKNYSIDLARIYATGASNGGLMTYRLLLEIPNRMAAGAVFIANLPSPKSLLSGASGHPRPIMIANGTKDPLMPYDGGATKFGRGRGRVLSFKETVFWWVRYNRANLEQAEARIIGDQLSEDNCTIHQTIYPGELSGAPVVAITVDGGGHSMPSKSHLLPNKFLVRRLLGPGCQAAEGAEMARNFLKGFALADR